jgi:hypothetical protein
MSARHRKIIYCEQWRTLRSVKFLIALKKRIQSRALFPIDVLALRGLFFEFWLPSPFRDDLELAASAACEEERFLVGFS